MLQRAKKHKKACEYERERALQQWAYRQAAAQSMQRTPCPTAHELPRSGNSRPGSNFSPTLSNWHHLLDSPLHTYSLNNFVDACEWSFRRFTYETLLRLLLPLSDKVYTTYDEQTNQVRGINKGFRCTSEQTDSLHLLIESQWLRSSDAHNTQRRFQSAVKFVRFARIVRICLSVLNVKHLKAYCSNKGGIASAVWI